MAEAALMLTWITSDQNNPYSKILKSLEYMRAHISEKIFSGFFCLKSAYIRKTSYVPPTTLNISWRFMYICSKLQLEWLEFCFRVCILYFIIRWQSGHIWLGLGCGFSEFQESVNEKAKKHVPECFPHLV